MPADIPSGGELVGIQQLVFFSRRARGDVQSRENPLVGYVAIQRQLHIASSFELLEDDLIHSASGIDQAGGDDRETAAVLDLSGSAEEPFGNFEGPIVEAAGHRPSTAR